MNLIKDIWQDKDILEYKNYVKTLKSTEKDCIWEKRVINTNLECFGKSSSKAREIAKQISKGNYVSFLDNVKIENMLDSLVFAHLISKIKDFDVFSKYLKRYVLTIDSWASSDTLKFEKKDKIKLEQLSQEFLKSDKCYVRRTGVNFWFEIIKDKSYLQNCFEMLNNLSNETEYYVNMCGAWLLAEVFAKYRLEALEYFKNNRTNNFIINKAISKCRDSFRVNDEDKELLKSFKKFNS